MSARARASRAIRWGAVALAVIATTACDDAVSHIYLGNLYEPALQCLDSPSAVDVVAGGEVNTNCTPLCLVSPPQIDDAGEDTGVVVYVSSMCGQTPFGFDTSGTNPECVPALAALTRGDACEDGGISTAPPPPDAGIDATLLDANVVDATSIDTGADAGGG